MHANHKLPATPIYNGWCGSASHETVRTRKHAGSAPVCRVGNAPMLLCSHRASSGMYVAYAIQSLQPVFRAVELLIRFKGMGF